MNQILDGSSLLAPKSATLLCVDDDPEVLSSLQRLFRDSGYRVQVAESGASGLLALENEPVDLVISDTLGPEMTGARFLQQVRKRWPDTPRLLLTGDQADVSSIVEAVNQGQVSRYITKPWDEAELLHIVGDVLEHRAAQREKAMVSEIAKRRSEELNALNSILQLNVNANLEELSAANAKLKDNLIVTLKVFSSLIETRHERLAGHSRRVADLVRKLAAKLELNAALVREVFFAALLHEVGKLGFTDDLLNTPVANMSLRQIREYRQHVVRAEQLLMPLQDLRGAATTIGAQLERYDGTGFPNQLRGRAIVVGARILSVCTDYDNLKLGVLAPRESTAKEALAVIVSSAGKRYDPWVVEAFVAIMSEGVTNPVAGEALNPNEMLFSAEGLVEGMVLARDLVAPTGVMMLSAGHPLDSRLIDKITAFEKSLGEKLSIYVKKEDMK